MEQGNFRELNELKVILPYQIENFEENENVRRGPGTVCDGTSELSASAGSECADADVGESA